MPNLIEMSAAERKNRPMARGVLDYFPNALAEVAHLSKVGNDQHNPGQPMHWAKGKSTDHADCIMRHLADRGTRDTDGERHSAKVAWRALALLEYELAAEQLGLSMDAYVKLIEAEQRAKDNGGEHRTGPVPSIAAGPSASDDPTTFFDKVQEAVEDRRVPRYEPGWDVV